MSKRRELERIRQKKRKRINLIIGVSVSVCLVVVIAVLIITSLRNTAVKANYTIDSSGNLHVPLDGLHDNLNYINYKGSEELILWTDGDGSVRTALDTCIECFPMGYVHFTLAGSILTCSACGTTQSVTGLGTAGWSGCKPISITPEMREDTDSEIVIPSAALAFAEDMFSHWRNSDFSVTFASYIAGEAHSHG